MPFTKAGCVAADLISGYLAVKYSRPVWVWSCGGGVEMVTWFRSGPISVTGIFVHLKSCRSNSC